MAVHCPRQLISYIAILVWHLSFCPVFSNQFYVHKCIYLLKHCRVNCQSWSDHNPKWSWILHFIIRQGWFSAWENGEFIYLIARAHTQRPPWSSANAIILSKHTGERIKWRSSLIKLFWGPLKFCWPFYGTLECKLQLSGPFSHSQPMKVMKLDSVLHGSALSSARLVSSLTAPRRGVTRILLISHKRRINRRDNHGHNVRPRHLLDDIHNITPIIRWFDSSRPGHPTPINTCAHVKRTED